MYLIFINKYNSIPYAITNTRATNANCVQTNCNMCCIILLIYDLALLMTLLKLFQQQVHSAWSSKSTHSAILQEL